MSSWLIPLPPCAIAVSRLLGPLIRPLLHLPIQIQGILTQLLNPDLVCSLEWWNSLALILVQGRANNGSVSEIDFAVRRLLPCESVLHPFIIQTIGVILAGVCTARFLAVRGGGSCLRTVKHSQ